MLYVMLRYYNYILHINYMQQNDEENDAYLFFAQDD